MDQITVKALYNLTIQDCDLIVYGRPEYCRVGRVIHTIQPKSRKLSRDIPRYDVPDHFWCWSNDVSANLFRLGVALAHVIRLRIKKEVRLWSYLGGYIKGYPEREPTCCILWGYGLYLCRGPEPILRTKLLQYIPGFRMLLPDSA